SRIAPFRCSAIAMGTYREACAVRLLSFQDPAEVALAELGTGTQGSAAASLQNIRRAEIQTTTGWPDRLRRQGIRSCLAVAGAWNLRLSPGHRRSMAPFILKCDSLVRRGSRTVLATPSNGESADTPIPEEIVASRERQRCAKSCRE